MDKRIILDANGIVYYFDGKTMEEAGKAARLTSYQDGIQAVGEDLYYKNATGEYELVAEKAKRVEFTESEFKSQFYLSEKGNLFFKQDDNVTPDRLPKAYAKYLSRILNVPQELNKQHYVKTENAFIALGNDGTAKIFKKEKGEAPEAYPEVSEAYVTTVGADTCMAWNGMGFLLTEAGFMRLNASLMYKGCNYLLFSCGAFAFALSLNKPEIDVFAKPVKVEDTVEADVFITKDRDGQQLYHLTDEGIKYIATALGDLEISSDGTIKDTFTRTAAGTAFPNLPKETKISIYALEDGAYVQKK